MLKADRIFAWILFFSMILFFISGYGITKGIISSEQAINIHNKLLPPFVIAAFTIHTWYAIHFAFKRWKIWNWATKILLTLFFLTFVGFFGYLQYFYQKDSIVESNSTISDEADNNDSKSDSLPTTNTDSQTKTFTLSELAKYNGEDGQPAYVTVDNKVYDLSSVFQSGKHYSHFAGKELTSAFYSYHAAKVLTKYPIVGELTK